MSDQINIPAHILWVELATRISTQKLHYRSGDEETAAVSIFSLFGTVRGLMERYPEDIAFREMSLCLLNDTLRPYTARWHGWMIEDRSGPLSDNGLPRLSFRTPWLRRKFREELCEVQPLLIGYKLFLEELKDGKAASLLWIRPDEKTRAHLFSVYREENHLVSEIPLKWESECRCHSKVEDFSSLCRR